MGEEAIDIQKLSKKFIIGQEEHKNLRETLSQLFRKEKKKLSNSEFWALQDISFQVLKGEAVGIIGKNGAGKSTLLKILSKITDPTSGQATIHGRVSSLLEVGTGFHPELTGKENIYLNGTILGMSRKEIKSKLDEIVEFSGVEKFLHTPVKRYSSGMYVRLAFSVAAHLEPEILIIDEVLAVGDAEFQKKCLGKMEDVTGQGRTVLFVSHNLTAVQHLCSKCLLLENGKKVLFDSTNKAIEKYSESWVTKASNLSEIEERKGNGKLRFTSALVKDSTTKTELASLSSGADLTFQIDMESETNFSSKNIVLSIGFFTNLGQFLFACRNDVAGQDLKFEGSKRTYNCRMRKFPLRTGTYMINLMAMSEGVILDHLEGAITLQVQGGDFYNSGIVLKREKTGVFVNYDWTD